MFLFKRYIKLNYKFNLTPCKIQIVIEKKALKPLLCMKTAVRNFVTCVAVHGMFLICICTYIIWFEGQQ
jgi:hypothetical protein